MRKSYDFSKSKRNPYARRLKKQVTIRLDTPTLEYFKSLSDELGIPYQTLINLYLSQSPSIEQAAGAGVEGFRLRTEMAPRLEDLVSQRQLRGGPRDRAPDARPESRFESHLDVPRNYW